jgi:hypothetical protein
MTKVGKRAKRGSKSTIHLRFSAFTDPPFPFTDMGYRDEENRSTFDKN